MPTPRPTSGAAFVTLCLLSPALAAAQPNSAGIGITVLVLLVMSASAYLPLAAYRHWSGPWRMAALAPLLMLLLWVVLILAGRAADPSAHTLWQLEMFGWAMLTMVYMVVAFTIKSILDKSDRARR